jgi:hypothetical protein
MIPMRTSSVFKSRWMALLWAAGIIWLALDFGGSQAQTPDNAAANETGITDASGQPVTNEDSEKIANALGL